MWQKSWHGTNGCQKIGQKTHGRDMILHYLNIQFFTTLSMWQDGPSLALEFVYLKKIK